ncbi:hypothetical protein CHGG_00826 [Chaetomium globosum CBS 148.51]|uniref:Uncharacterized protein n=1 Tax=Chaetomium globosum (strain ATCC 6205 / CBS 148.51 / DSM 1962 / NBRC 6347 / NRRL 1970) TaxID=306901 RepID=Q2HG28_CHAGB|nr:uncharacterized protein CHGG_00826 [Chaetomium globosum CBS 148.51]EAQ92591.1 hypothetical protein CHGG_00826 [Chaetomium globosum CBS 148.51]
MLEDTNKTSQVKARAPKASAPAQPVDDSSDDGVDNREFARQLGQRQAGHYSQRAQEERREAAEISLGPFSRCVMPMTTSLTLSPEIKAADASGVSDMLEPKAGESLGPPPHRHRQGQAKKEKKAQGAREDRDQEAAPRIALKAEAAKALREESEKQRKVDLEAQRRQARIAEGRPAQDGSVSMAQAQQSVWTEKGANGTSSTNSGYLPVQPLDTFDTSSYTDVSAPKSETAKSAVPAKNNLADSWISTLPSEEEQMEMLRDEEAWNTVSTKKTKNKKKEAAAESPIDSEPTIIQPPPAAKAATASNGTSAAPKQPAKVFSQQSAFAALSTTDPEGEEENEWDV